jgi:hypothetical protein
MGDIERKERPSILRKTEWSEMPMIKDLSSDDERRGTRRIMLTGSAAAGALFVGLLGWFAIPHLLGTADNPSRPPSAADRTRQLQPLARECRHSAKQRATSLKTTLLD